MPHARLGPGCGEEGAGSDPHHHHPLPAGGKDWYLKAASREQVWSSPCPSSVLRWVRKHKRGPELWHGDDSLLRAKLLSQIPFPPPSPPENPATSPGPCPAFHGGAGWIFLSAPPAVCLSDSRSSEAGEGYFCASPAIPAPSDCAASAPQPCTAPPPPLFLAPNSRNNYFCLRS